MDQLVDDFMGLLFTKEDYAVDKHVDDSIVCIIGQGEELCYG